MFFLLLHNLQTLLINLPQCLKLAENEGGIAKFSGIERIYQWR